MSAREYTKTRRLFIPFLPFLFLGVIFVGHGTLALVLSLLVSAILTAGVSFLLLRRRTGSDTPLAGAFVAPATSAGLEGVLQLDAVGLHWMPRARLPLWFIPRADVVRTTVREAGQVSELHVELAGGDKLTLNVDAAVVELERALGHARVPKPR